MKVVIIGGGVMGMLTARELVREGVQVSLVDRGVPGGEASWAGGGIVSPLYPWRYPPAVTALATPAQAAYPALAAALYEETGVDPEYSPCGMLMLEPGDGRDAEVWARQNGKSLQVLDEEGLSELGYHSRGYRHGIWLPDVANIRNPRLLAALRASLSGLGVAIHEADEATGVNMKQGMVRNLRLQSGKQLEADDFAVTAGAWSGQLLSNILPSLPSPPIEPVKGQMLLFKDTPGVLRHIVLYQGHYVIPRRDGHILCGSTLEYTGFEKTTTNTAKSALQKVAEALVPSLRGKKPVSHWAGLRPGSPNGIPFIGKVKGAGNLWLNAGQFRNGLVLAPASCRLLADLMLGRPPCVDPEPYQVQVL